MAQLGPQQEIPKLISLVAPLGTRLGVTGASDPRNSPDAMMLNCYVDKTSSGLAVVKRPGTALKQILPVGFPQGLFRTGLREFAIVSEVLYNYFSGTPVAVAIPSTLSGNQPYSFCIDAQSSGAYFKNAGELFKTDLLATTVTKCTDPNFPSSTTPGMVLLDGTYYVLSTTDSAVHGSNFENAFAWNALNFIGADASYGPPVGLNLHLNYIQAFYRDGIVFYFNNGNTTGSPLSRVSNAVFRTGCLSGASIVELADTTIFVSKSLNMTGNTISQFVGSGMQEISTPAICRILDYDNLVGLSAYGIEIAGNSFYILNLPNSNKSLVYSMDTKVWVIWTLYDPVANPTLPNKAFYKNSFIDLATVDPIFQMDNGSIVRMNSDVYATTDNGMSILFFVRTPGMDWGSLTRKFIPDMHVLGDSDSYLLSVRYSNDDYKTFSAYRTVDMSQQRKLLTRCGSTRRRSWDVQYIGTSPVRLFGLEVMPAKGAES